jgi:DNA-binding transcriptional ArsR family regulator
MRVVAIVPDGPGRLTGTAGRVYLTKELINHMVQRSPLADPLSSTFAALADPTRRAILARLASGDRTVGELAEPFEMSMPAVSKHLKVLERAGLIARGRDGQYRPCRLEPAPLKDVSIWLERYRRIWDERFDRLDAYLRDVQARAPMERRQARSPRNRRKDKQG